MVPVRKGFSSRRLSLTPLIDVIFLLLLFFMLTSTFTRFAEVPLVQTGGKNAERIDKPPLFLRLSDEGLTVNGLVVTGDVEAGVTALIDGEAVSGLLSVGERVTSQQLVETLRVLQSIETLDLSVLQ